MDETAAGERNDAIIISGARRRQSRPTETRPTAVEATGERKDAIIISGASRRGS